MEKEAEEAEAEGLEARLVVRHRAERRAHGGDGGQRPLQLADPRDRARAEDNVREADELGGVGERAEPVGVLGQQGEGGEQEERAARRAGEEQLSIAGDVEREAARRVGKVAQQRRDVAPVGHRPRVLH